MDALISKILYHPIQKKITVINTFCHSLTNCIQEEENTKKEISRNKLIVKNNKYNMTIMDETLTKMKKTESIMKGYLIVKEKKEYKG